MANSPPQHLLNGYGPTEATTFSATYEITSVGNGSIPIGNRWATAACMCSMAKANR
ncbi:amino acid adenylation, partial [Pseudomonas syringae pv. japonica str. M301072]